MLSEAAVDGGGDIRDQADVDDALLTHQPIEQDQGMSFMLA